MALPASFLEELRVRTALPELIGRRVKLARSGRQWKGCCPFHDEKTPSFYVYDDHFHCFGCGTHGDAVSFVMQSQGLQFMEAVAQLAAAAGIAVPEPSPEVAAAERVREDLGAVLEAAAVAFHRRLFLPEGKAARAYLLGRGLTEATIRSFGLGWSGEGRGALAAELGREGISPDRLVAVGLMKKDEDSKYSEFFFNRVVFPIRDSRGRTLSFGGRTLGEGQPKYLNGPETDLFAKRRTLYGLDRARVNLRAAAPIVVEGYMDVIALHQAGFSTAVAPLGTALTEEQLGALWRYAEVPVICFDGDAAGARAAERLIEMALPLIGPGRTLAFANLPEGEDPDSLLRRGGVSTLRQLIAAPQPLFQALFAAVRTRTGEATPEQRAALRAHLEAQAARIRDLGVAREYRRTLLDLSFRSRRDTKAARTARPDPSGLAADRPRQLLAVLLRYPALLAETEEKLASIPMPLWLGPLCAQILQWGEGVQPLDSTGLIAHLHAVGLAAEASRVLADEPLPVCRVGLSLAEARAGLQDLYDRLVTLPRLKADVEAGKQDFALRGDAATQSRLTGSRAEELNVLHSSKQDQSAD